MSGKVLKEDVELALSDGNIPWEALRRSTVLVTGATGLVGSAIVRVLAAANAKYGLGLKIIAHGRDTLKGNALREEYETEFIFGDIRSQIPAEALPPAIDYILHCSAVTKSESMAGAPVEVIDTAVLGTKNILALAAEKSCRSAVYLSSVEVYGHTELSEVTESDLGFLELKSPRSGYPESKRLCECLCAAYLKQYRVPVKIARLAQTFGAGTPRDDSRVFAQFLRSAAAGENITLHTPGNSVGNYCCITDTVRGLLVILLKGINGEAYNIANPAATMTVRDMAALVAEKVFGGKVKAVVKPPKDPALYGYAPDRAYRMNIDKLKALGWAPTYGLEDMYRHMLADWEGP